MAQGLGRGGPIDGAPIMGALIILRRPGGIGGEGRRSGGVAGRGVAGGAAARGMRGLAGHPAFRAGEFIPNSSVKGA